MTIVFDLDYTLLDAGKLKNALALSLSDCGVPEERFWQTYEHSSRVSDKICDYDPARHVEHLSNDLLTCDAPAAIRRIDATVARTSEFLYPGATALLERLRADGARLVLLTQGNVGWQKRKVAASGLASYFDELLFVAEEKEAAVEKLRMLDQPVTFVNDNGREIDRLQKLLPDMRMIAVKGPKPLPTDPAVPVCADFEDVYKAITRR